jgi:hypothetical protein
MKVKATQQGFYNGRHIDPGTVFDVIDKDFASAETKFGWMEKVAEKPAAPITPAKGFFK